LIQPFCLVENCSFSIKGLTPAKLTFQERRREKSESIIGKRK
jgi:hypothetical protein